MDNSISALLPTVCILCGRLGPMICKKCSYACEVINEPVCLVCQEPSIDGLTHRKCYSTSFPTQLFSCFAYEDKVRKAIRQSKYEPYIYGALEELTHCGIKYALSVGYYIFDFILVPVPLSKKRRKTRGFNQAELIAEVLAKYLGLRLDVSNLIRVKETIVQAELSREERQKNLQKAFLANPKVIKDKKILLIDDIATTGATLIECSQALYAAGAAEVRCFTLSRVL